MSEHQSHVTESNDDEARMRALLGNHSLAIIEVTSDGLISLASRSLCHWLGRDQGSLAGMPLDELVSPEDRASVARQLGRIADESIDSSAMTHRLRNASGADLWVRSSWSARRADGGAITHIIAIVENFAREREDALVRSILEESIRGLEDRRRFIDRMIAGLPVIAWRALPNGVCEYLSPQWATLTGMRDGSGLRWLAAIHPEDRRLFVASWSSESTPSDQPRRIACRLHRADGSFDRFDVVGSPLRDDAGAVTAWTGVFILNPTPKPSSRTLIEPASRIDQVLRPLANRPPEPPNGSRLRPS
jgi:PAS domain S-box-containing protein